MLNAVLHRFESFITGYTQSCRTGSIFRTGALTFLLTAAQHQRFHLQTFAHIQHANTFRTMNFVTTHGQHINFHFFYVDGVFAEGLYRIHMEQALRIFFFDELTDGSRILNGTCFVIYQNDAYQYCVRSDGVSQFFQRDMTFSVYRKPCHFTAVFFQLFHRIFHSRMFDLCCDKVFPFSSVAFRCAVDGPVIAFCAAAGEEDFFIFCTNAAGNDVRCISDFLFHSQTHYAYGRRVTILFAEHHAHFFRYGRQCSGCCCIVKINHVFPSFLKPWRRCLQTSGKDFVPAPYEGIIPSTLFLSI